MEKIDLIDLLNNEFKHRYENNPHYSLRAFARDLDVQPATLSHILNRKRVPSNEFKNKSYKALELSKVENITQNQPL